MNKNDKQIAVSCTVLIVLTVLGFLSGAALTWVIAQCVGFDWSWKIALAAWAVIFLLRMVFGGRK